MRLSMLDTMMASFLPYLEKQNRNAVFRHMYLAVLQSLGAKEETKKEAAMGNSKKSLLVCKVAKSKAANQEAHAKNGLVHVHQPRIRAHQVKLRRQVKGGYKRFSPKVTTNS